MKNRKGNTTKTEAVMTVEQNCRKVIDLDKPAWHADIGDGLLALSTVFLSPGGGEAGSP